MFIRNFFFGVGMLPVFEEGGAVECWGTASRQHMQSAGGLTGLGVAAMTGGGEERT